ncbi:hypothetical protein RHGRI_028909 [Rhododendron griersonianum]|uniref:EF-hand domain-containing protein n=1 Tax=Rhododendron griersonianum TaxID=479676 RepID=A0AAV6IJG6_9ERIC|nr:hypothetical protein RHGRI_028909 [Rhododendron griersonianum]
MEQTPRDAIQQRSLTSLGGMDEVQKVFNKFDTNGDGKISVSELRSVFKALGVDVGTSSADLTNAVTEIDKDGDGAIDLEEFADFHRAAACGGESNGGKAIGDAFEMYDQDSNGLISAQELHEKATSVALLLLITSRKDSWKIGNIGAKLQYLTISMGKIHQY